jgi:hypothetical protein
LDKKDNNKNPIKFYPSSIKRAVSTTTNTTWRIYNDLSLFLKENPINAETQEKMSQILLQEINIPRE